jgi:hypothetical protein
MRVVLRVLVESAAASWPYGSTRNDTLLASMPLGVTTLTSPVVAPAGASVMISERGMPVKVAGVPLKLTSAAPVSLASEVDGRPNVARGGSVSKRAQTDRQAENRATGAAAVVVDNFAATKGRPIEGPIGGPNQLVWARAIRVC